MHKKANLNKKWKLIVCWENKYKSHRIKKTKIPMKVKKAKKNKKFKKYKHVQLTALKIVFAVPVNFFINKSSKK